MSPPSSSNHRPLSSTRIRYCPACGSCSFQPNSAKSFLCSQCGFTLYLNAAAAVAAIVERQDEILLVVRGSEPSAGMLDLPGGFVDHQETIEAALVRELQEELGLDVLTMMGDTPVGVGLRHHPAACPLQLTDLSSCYVGSFPNTYHYRDVVYETVDMFYRLVLPYKPELTANDDVSGLVWVSKQAIPLDRIAFSSVRDILCQCYGFENTD